MIQLDYAGFPTGVKNMRGRGGGALQNLIGGIRKYMGGGSIGGLKWCSEDLGKIHEKYL